MSETTSQQLQKQPNSRNCFGCGLENLFGLQIIFYDDGEDEVFADYVVPDHFEGYPGVVHGGIVATMLDELLGRAVMAGDRDHFRMTAKIVVRYRNPVPTGEALKLIGKVERRRGRLAQARAEIRLPDGSLGAEAEATLVDIPGFEMNSEELKQLGWEIYPESPSE